MVRSGAVRQVRQDRRLSLDARHGAGRVHYRPMPGETPGTVKAEVPFCPVLVSLEGTPENGRYVEDIVVRNNIFAFGKR